MKKDILGNQQLESIEISWDIIPTARDKMGKCAATGTCEVIQLSCTRKYNFTKNSRLNCPSAEKKALEIKTKYGYLIS
jgi:hypothetical protein